MKLIGISFIIFSTASVGLRFAHAVKQRCDVIGQLILALRMLKSELLTHGTPFPEAFGVIAASSQGSTAEFFASAAKTMAKKRWISPSDSLLLAEVHLVDLPEEDPVRKIVREFSLGIGKFDLDGQVKSIDNTLSRLEFVLHTAEQDKSVRCRIYRSLGLCTGLALAILLA